jgi:hypothetical protein
MKNKWSEYMGTARIYMALSFGHAVSAGPVRPVYLADLLAN